MMMECRINMEELRSLLFQCVGSTLPIKLIGPRDQSEKVYVRGFADSDQGILLISQYPDTAGKNIIELKNILVVETEGLLSLKEGKFNRFLVK
jgi:hypothetical protein